MILNKQDKRDSLSLSFSHRWSCNKLGDDKLGRVDPKKMLRTSTLPHDDDSSIDGSCHVISGRSALQSAKTSQATSSIPKSVRFDGSLNQIYVVESYVSYSSDLWWPNSEMKQRQARADIALSEYPMEELLGISDYAKAYYKAQRSLNESMLQSKVIFATKEYQMIVRGKAFGWNGMEASFMINGTVSRSKRATEIIRSIVVAHRKYACKSKDAESKLRYISKSLTRLDRSWAVVMGATDYDASRLREGV